MATDWEALAQSIENQGKPLPPSSGGPNPAPQATTGNKWDEMAARINTTPPPQSQADPANAALKGTGYTVSPPPSPSMQLDKLDSSNVGPQGETFGESFNRHANPLPGIKAGLQQWWNRPGPFESINAGTALSPKREESRTPGVVTTAPASGGQTAFVKPDRKTTPTPLSPKTEDMFNRIPGAPGIMGDSAAPPNTEGVVSAAQQARHGNYQGAAGTMLGTYGPQIAIAGALKYAPEIGDMLHESAKKNYVSVLRPTKALVPKAERLAEDMTTVKPIAGTRSGLQLQAENAMADVGPAAGTAYRGRAPISPDSIMTDLEGLRAEHAVVRGTGGVVSNEHLNNTINGIKGTLNAMKDEWGLISPESLDDYRGKLFSGLVNASGNYRDLVSPETMKALEQSAARSIKRVLETAHPDAAKLKAEYHLWSRTADFMKKAHNAEVASESAVQNGTALGARAALKFVPRPVRMLGNIPLQLVTMFDSVAWNTISAATKQSIADAISKSQWGRVQRLIPPSHRLGPGGLNRMGPVPDESSVTGRPGMSQYNENTRALPEPPPVRTNVPMGRDAFRENWDEHMAEHHPIPGDDSAVRGGPQMGGPPRPDRQLGPGLPESPVRVTPPPGMGGGPASIAVNPPGRAMQPETLQAGGAAPPPPPRSSATGQSAQSTKTGRKPHYTSEEAPAGSKPPKKDYKPRWGGKALTEEELKKARDEPFPYARGGVAVPKPRVNVHVKVKVGVKKSKLGRHSKRGIWYGPPHPPKPVADVPMPRIPRSK